MKSLVQGACRWVLLALCPLVFFLAHSPIDGARAQATEEFVPGELLVKFHPGTTRAEVDQAHLGAQARVISTFRKDTDLYHVKLPDNASLAAARAHYRGRSSVKYAELNHIVRAVVTPNDPLFPQLWGMQKIEAPAAWDTWTGEFAEFPPVIASIDTGVDYNHPDLTGNIWFNSGELTDFPNGIDDDGNGYVDDVIGWDFVNNDFDPMDDNNHGTHTAGTIAAAGNNFVGVVGAVWRAQIMPLKFLSAGGSGTIANAIRAIDYATDKGARISNNSWGCSGQLLCNNQALKEAISRNGHIGAIFVAAAGNSNQNLDGVTIFDNYNLVAVAATTQSDTRASFSNWGPSTVHLGAPGVSILSTIRNGGYATFSGTSMAAPHTAGVFGLIWSFNPFIPTTDVIHVVLSSVDPVGLPVISGGRLNARRALESIALQTRQSRARG